MTEAAYSRSGASNPFGKCDQPLKTEVPEQVKNDFTGVAFGDGITPGERLRDLVMCDLYGVVSPEMRKIVWDHVCNETDSELIRKVMHSYIYGSVHVASVARQENLTSSEIERHYKQGGGNGS